jgi:ubiquinone/menaquinone biosynthesis C-methylase UbiE
MATKPELWNRQLELQVDLTSEEDVAHLRRLPEFVRAQEILEIGCGSGAFLSRIAGSFADKNFVGIDIDEKLLEVARGRMRAKGNLRFLHRDIYDIKDGAGEFDLIVLRLVVQHLKDLGNLVDICSRLLKENGALLVIEALDEKTGFFPEVPTAMKLFANIRKMQPKGGPRRALRAIKRLASKHGLTAKSDLERVYKTSERSRAKATVSAMYENVASLAPRAFGVTIDRRKLHRELERWEADEQSTFQFGFRFLLFEKKAGLLGALVRWLDR